MARIKKRPDYEALDDLGFVGWGNSLREAKSKFRSSFKTS